MRHAVILTCAVCRRTLESRADGIARGPDLCDACRRDVAAHNAEIRRDLAEAQYAATTGDLRTPAQRALEQIVGPVFWPAKGGRP